MKLNDIICEHNCIAIEEDKEQIIPDCTICSKQIDINYHRYCPGCKTTWCSQCAQEKLANKQMCPECNQVNIEDIKPKYKLEVLKDQEQKGVSCEKHEKETSLYCIECKEVLCTECLKEKFHFKHDTSGDPNEVAQEYIKAANKNIESIESSENIIIVNINSKEEFIAQKERLDEYEPTFLLFKLYVDEANKVLVNLNDIKMKLRSITSKHASLNNRFYNNASLYIEISKNLLKIAEDFLDLNLFINKKRMESEEISSTERIIKFQPNDINKENTTQRIYINENTYEITFIKVNELFDVKFEWTKYPKIWSYDLRINFLFKNARESFKELNDFSVPISKFFSASILCTINPLELIASKALESASEEECKDKSKSKPLKKEMAKQISSSSLEIEALEFKVKIGKVDYGYKKHKQEILFRNLEHNMLKKYQ